MTTTEMDTKTDLYAKSDATSFALSEKLTYYVEADGILNGLIIDQQEERAEEEWENDTVTDQTDYEIMARLHNINWLEINYGSGFIPARYVGDGQLIELYGSQLETTLTGWDGSDPIYNFSGNHIFIYPAPTAAQAGVGRLRASVELLPEDLEANDIPELVPLNFQYLHCAYAALSWLDEDDPLWKKAKRKWDEGISLMLETMYPRSQQDGVQSGHAYDDGSDY